MARKDPKERVLDYGGSFIKAHSGAAWVALSKVKAEPWSGVVGEGVKATWTFPAACELIPI